MLKKVIIVRHGSYDSQTEHLNAEGVQEIEAILPSIRKHLGEEKSILFLSSDQPRAIESLKIIAHGYSSETHTDEYYFNEDLADPNHMTPLLRLEDWAARHQTSTVILVTHAEFATLLPYLVIEKYNLTNCRAPHTIGKGHFVYIDIENDALHRG